MVDEKPAAAKPLILIVDDERDIRHILRVLLERLNYAVEEAGTGGEGLTKAMTMRPSAILLDQKLPDFDGYEVHTHLVRLGFRIPTAVISAIAGVDHVAERYGIQHFLQKPIQFELLKPLIERLLAS